MAALKRAFFLALLGLLHILAIDGRIYKCGDELPAVIHEKVIVPNCPGGNNNKQPKPTKTKTVVQNKPTKTKTVVENKPRPTKTKTVVENKPRPTKTKTVVDNVPRPTKTKTIVEKPARPTKTKTKTQQVVIPQPPIIVTQPVITQPIITQTVVTQPIITQPIVPQPPNTVTVTQPGGGDSDNLGTITITLVDSNNNPLTNLVINVVDSNGNLVWTGVTNGNGQVTITLPPGTYVLIPQWPDGLRPASPNDRFSFVINPGQNQDITHIFLVSPNGPGIITISVKDSSGMPMPGVAVEIVDTDENPVQQVTTNNDGMAQVSLPAGQYIVRPILPNHTGSLVHNLSVAANERQLITFIIPNTPVPTQVTTGTIAGHVYNDANLNGHVDSGEGISGIVVTIFASNGGQQQTATNGDGYYTVENLPPGSYRIEVGEIPGIEVAMDARTRTVQLGPGATIIFNVQLINVPSTTFPIPVLPTERPGTILARVFYDTNWNQIYDSNELPAADIPIALLNSNQNFVATDRTSASGMVQFQNVPMGTYTVMADLRTVEGVGVTSVEGLVEMINSGERFNIDFAIQLYTEELKVAESA